MSIMDWSVILGGVTAIAWINWYFFWAPATVRTHKQAERTQNPM